MSELLSSPGIISHNLPGAFQLVLLGQQPVQGDWPTRMQLTVADADSAPAHSERHRQGMA
jgi:hypothetical protein